MDVRLSLSELGHYKNIAKPLGPAQTPVRLQTKQQCRPDAAHQTKDRSTDTSNKLQKLPHEVPCNCGGGGCFGHRCDPSRALLSCAAELRLPNGCLCTDD